MSQDSSRKALHAYLSTDAHEMWHEFAATQGVSVSAVLEALASTLTPEERDKTTPMTDRLATVVSTARGIDAERRRRRR